MANECDFKMRILGREQNVDELMTLLRYENNGTFRGFGHIWEIDIISEHRDNGLYCVDTAGACAWSIHSSLIDVPTTQNILNESKRLGLAVEIYSKEPGFAFSEHYIIARGEMLREECIDYEEINILGMSAAELDAFSRKSEHSIEELKKLADENDGYVAIGGFGECYADFENLRKYLKNDTSILYGENALNIFEKLRKKYIAEDILGRYFQNITTSISDERLNLLSEKVIKALDKNDDYWEIYWDTIKHVIEAEKLLKSNK